MISDLDRPVQDATDEWFRIAASAAPDQWPLLRVLRLESTAAFQQLVESLKTQPDITPLLGRMHLIPGAGMRVEARELAHWLVGRSSEATTAQAILDLQRYVEDHAFEVFEVFLLAGVSVTQPVELAEGLSLVPRPAIPVDLPFGLPERLGPFPPEYVGLVHRYQWPKTFRDDHENDPLPRQDLALLRDAQLVLTLAGPSSPRLISLWTKPGPEVPWPGGAPFSSPASTTWTGPPTKIDEHLSKVPDLLARFRRLRGESARSVRLALERLNSSLSHRSLADSAVDLGIAMEAAFLADSTSSTSELSFRLAVRAARLLRTEVSDRREVYEVLRDAYRLRSKVVHGGSMSREKQQRARETVQHASVLAGEGIEYLIRNPNPDWLGLVLG